MSEICLGKDCMADYAFECDYPFGVPNDTWVTKSGNKIKLADMSESHLKNCMRTVGEYDEWYQVL